MDTDITEAGSHLGSILGDLYDSLDEECKEMMVGIFSSKEGDAK